MYILPSMLVSFLEKNESSMLKPDGGNIVELSLAYNPDNCR